MSRLNQDQTHAAACQCPAIPLPCERLPQTSCSGCRRDSFALQSIAQRWSHAVRPAPAQLWRLNPGRLRGAGVCAITDCVTGSMRSMAPQSGHATSKPISLGCFFAIAKDSTRGQGLEARCCGRPKRQRHGGQDIPAPRSPLETRVGQRCSSPVAARRQAGAPARGYAGRASA